MTRQLPRTIHHSQTTPPVLSSLWRKVDQLDDGLKSEGEWEDDEEETASKPLARVGTQIFQGHHAELIGHDLFFLPLNNEKTGYEPMQAEPHQSRITFEPCTVLLHQEAARRRPRGRKVTKAPKQPADPNAPKRGPGRPKGSKNQPKLPGYIKPPPQATKPKARKKQTEAVADDEPVSPTPIRRSSRPVKPTVKRAAANAASTGAEVSQSDSEQSLARGSAVYGL